MKPAHTWSYGSALLLALLGACTSSSNPTDPFHPEAGDNNFESAGNAGSKNGRDDSAESGGDAAEAPSDDADEERTVEEADLYRFVNDKLYVLNQYRGLFVFDVSNPDQPEEIGRMPLSGYPVEMYVRGDRAYAIISDYFSYFRSELEDGGLEPQYGSRIVGIDLSDPSDPQEIGDVFLDGYVADTRLVGDIIYAVANRYSWWGEWGAPASESRDETVLTSIAISDSAHMTQVAQQTLDGNGWFVHATSDAFIVAGNVWDTSDDGYYYGNQHTQVQYVDISDPEGALALRGDVRIDGYLQDDSAINIYEDQLRLITRDWSDDTTRLRIYDISHPDTLAELGQLDYSYNGGLYGTTFDGDRAYMVHYEQVDPLDVVDLSDPTHPAITGILEMPGFVERIAALGDRLIGLGTDDTSGWNTSISLFDVSNIAAPALLSRIHTDTQWSWSQASYERKAWTVDANEGIILFPYSGSNYDETHGYYSYRNALGIIEFDRDTLTARGEVEGDAPFDRGAIYHDRVYALSQSTLSVVDIRDRAAPVAKATVELTRNVYDYARTGEVGVELVQPGVYYWYGDTARATSLRVTPRNQPDGREELARIELPRHSEGLFAYNDKVVAIRPYDGCYYGYYGEDDADGSSCDDSLRAGLTVVSLANPEAPSIQADIDLPEPDRIARGSYGDDGYVSDWTSWRTKYDAPLGGWQGGNAALDLGNGHIGLLRTREIYCSGVEACAAAGVDAVTTTYDRCGDDIGPTAGEDNAPAVDGDTDSDTKGDEGGMTAPDYDGEPADCTYTYTNGYKYENSLFVLDLSSSTPTLLDEIPLGEGTIEHLFVQDRTLIYAHAEPSRTDDSGRSWIRYYMERLSIGADGSVTQQAAVNVPGVVIALRDGGNTAITLDRVWSEEANEYGWYDMLNYVNAVRIDGDVATRTDSIDLGSGVGTLVTQGDYAYYVKNPDSGYYYGGGVYAEEGDVAVGGAVDALDAPELAKLATLDIHDRSRLRATSEQDLGSGYWTIAWRADHALLLSGGWGSGLAVFNTDGHESEPAFTRYARTNGWQVSIRQDGDEMFLSGGPYGIQTISLAE